MMLVIHDNRTSFAKSVRQCLRSLLVLSGTAFIGVNAYGTQYYIDNSNSAACNDSGTGQNQSAPWCDFNTFNSTTFQPGDTISLKSGDVWNLSQQITLNGSGNSTSGAITLNSYGSGAQPKIEYGTSTAGSVVVSGTNISYWTIQNLEIEDTSTYPFDPTNSTLASSAISLNYSDSATHSNITISNNTIHGTGTAQNNMLLVIFANYSSRSTDAVDDITINDNTIYDGGRALVYLAGYVNGQEMTYYTGGGYGNLQFYGNTLHDSALQGAVITAALGSSVFDNKAYNTGLYAGSGENWGAGALWTLGSYNSSFYNNEVYNSGAGGYGHDAPGFDIDWDNNYVTAFGNYLHDNTGPGMLILASDHAAASYNRIYSNQQSTLYEPAQIAILGYSNGHLSNVTNANVSHNIIVLNTSASRGLSTYGFGESGWYENSFTNNYVAFIASAWAYDLGVDGYGPMATMDYNTFYDGSGSYFQGTLDGTSESSLTGPSGWQAVTGYDTHSTIANYTTGVWQAWSDFAPPNHTSNQWSYQYSMNDEISFQNATWEEYNGQVGQYWYGPEAYCWIYSPIDPYVSTPMMSPGGNSCDAVLTWTAPNSGTADITAGGQNISVWAGGAGCGGQGVNIRIMRTPNGGGSPYQIWPSTGWQYIANGGSYTFPPISEPVNSGDSLNFVVQHNGSNNYCDHTSWDPTIVL